MITAKKIMKEYMAKGYSCMAWTTYLPPWRRCSCGRRGLFYSLWTRQVFIMWREKWKAWQSIIICDKCAESHLADLKEARASADL